MKTNELKTEFVRYLQELPGGQDKYGDLSADNISLFDYQDEFRNFVNSELGSAAEGMNFDDISTENFGNGENAITDLLSNIASYDSALAALDVDGDGMLGETELQLLVDATKGFDANDGNVTLKDISMTMDSIAQNTFISFLDVDTLETKQQLTTEALKVCDNIKNCQEAYELAQKGESPELEGLKDAEEAAYDTFITALGEIDAQLQSDYISLKDEVDNTEKALAETDIEINNQEKISKESHDAYAQLDSMITSLDGKRSEYEGMLSKTEDATEKASINAKIKYLDDQIDNLQRQKDKAEETFNAADLELERLNNKVRPAQESAYNDAKNALENFETKTLPNYSENATEAEKTYQDAKDTYLNAKATFDNAREQAISTAKTMLTKSQEYLNEINIKLAEITAEEIKKQSENPPAQEAPYMDAPYSMGGAGAYSPGGVYGNKSLEKPKTKEDLTADKVEAESNVDENLSSYEQVVNSETEELSQLNEKKDSAFSAFLANILMQDKIYAAQVQQLKDDVDEQQSLVNAKNIEIAKQSLVVSGAQNAYDNAVTLRTSLETALKDFDEYIETLPEDQQRELAAKRKGLVDKLTEAQSAEGSAEQALKDAQGKLATLEDKKKELIEGENGLNAKQAALMNECNNFVLANPSAQGDLTAFVNAQTEYDTAKQTAMSNSMTTLMDSQTAVNNINTDIANLDMKNILREFSPTDGAAAAVDWARQYDDLSQSQIRQIFSQFGYPFHEGAWCADFVRMALGQGVGDENLPDWYQNCSNKAYCPTIQQYGEGHQISAEDAQMGDLVLYDWDNDGLADHVGLFVDNGNGSSTITAIEGNTSGAGGGSCVEEKARNRSTILGIYSMRK